MELLSANLPRTHRIILAGDWHYGTKACYLKGIMAMLEQVKRERNTYLILMGDLIEAIAVDDFRYDPAVHSPQTPLAQAEVVADMIKPVKRKVLACLTGNHEQKLYRYGDITKYICERAGVPYGGYSCKVAIKSGDELLYKIFATHGRLSVSSNADDPVRRLSNKRLAIKRKLQHLAGDCYIMACGHTHQLLSLEKESHLYLTDDGNHLQARYTEGVQTAGYLDPNLRYYINTGSFLKSGIVGFCTYSEQAGYQPLQLGFSSIETRDGIVKGVHEHRLG